MSPATERLIQLAVGLALLFYGWQFAAQTVVTILSLQQRVQTCEAQQLGPKRGP